MHQAEELEVIQKACVLLRQSAHSSWWLNKNEMPSSWYLQDNVCIAELSMLNVANCSSYTRKAHIYM